MSQPRRVALIAGVTGMGGLNLAKKMLSTDKYGQWTVYGLSRRTSKYLPPEVNHICCDLLDAALCKERLGSLSDVTHVFYTTWINKLKESDNIEANGTMMRNLLNNLPTKPQHVVLLTGMKHYLGSFEAMAAAGGPSMIHPTPFKESMGRIPGDNFYYTQEDILFEAAAKEGFSWSVARPGTIIGFAPFNQMDFGTSLAVYAAICKYAGRPFYFPGNQSGYNSLCDITDAELLAEHMLWEATDPKAKNQAYNVGNGDLFRFKHMWKVVADDFELDVPDKIRTPPADPAELETIWNEMVEKFELQRWKLEEITTLWFLQITNFPADMFADLTKSREHGFLVYQNSEKTFLNLFDYLRENKFIPGKSTY